MCAFGHSFERFSRSDYWKNENTLIMHIVSSLLVAAPHKKKQGRRKLTHLLLYFFLLEVSAKYCYSICYSQQKMSQEKQFF